MNTVLFVCTGNTCRSPMAEAIMDDLIDEHPSLSGLEISSAGTFACEGAEIAEFAAEALEEMGVRPPRHKARPISAELIDQSDLILTMQAQHLEEICALSPEAEGKVHTLKGYVEGMEGYVPNENYDIDDPYREPYEVYKECASELKRCIQLLIMKLEGVTI